jgi:hypothetical protein
MEEILRIIKLFGVLLVSTCLFCWLLTSELDSNDPNLILTLISFVVGVPLLGFLGIATME